VAGVVKTLMDRRLVKIVGRKDVAGRPMMFGTTKEFLQAFGLKDLSDLPTLRDFAEIARASDPLAESPDEAAVPSEPDDVVEVADAIVDDPTALPEPRS
jgi:segregation and condensation protein B